MARGRAMLAVGFVAMALIGSAGDADAAGGAATASCVRDFFAVAWEDHALSPPEVVELINADGDPTFQVDNVGHLRERVANAEIGIFDREGVFHICPTPP